MRKLRQRREEILYNTIFWYSVLPIVFESEVKLCSELSSFPSSIVTTTCVGAVLVKAQRKNQDKALQTVFHEQKVFETNFTNVEQIGIYCTLNITIQSSKYAYTALYSKYFWGHVKNNIAKYRRQTLTTGGGQACLELSELDLRIGAIIGETALSGVPSAGDLDTDLDPMSAVSSPRPSPISEAEGKLFFSELIQFDNSFYLKAVAAKPWKLWHI